MEKYDIKREFKPLFAPGAKDFVEVDVPTFGYLAVDGSGDPNTSQSYSQAIAVLYPVAYALKFAGKAQGRDCVVAPLEALWWAEDMSTFLTRDKDAWSWRVMISTPPWVDAAAVADAVAATAAKKDLPALELLRFQPMTEGRCLQILHVGPYDDEGPTLERLHNRVIPERGLRFNGHHHEIYLSDPRRVAPEKLRTILRQPVAPAWLRSNGIGTGYSGDVSELAVHKPLVDAFGRTARDLRVSLTDRCNLRCTYCMPAEGMEWMPTDKVLSDTEVIRLVRIAVETLGIVKVRFTGGEPLLRKGLEHIIAATSALRTVDGGRPELMLTTNGLGLEHRARALKDAGLDRVNISLDSLDPERYARLARRDRLHDVLAAIDASAEVGLTPVKVNSVIMRGQNEQDIVPLADYCLRRGHQLRYIEQMPLGPREEWDRSQMVTQTEILDALGEHYTLTPGSAPRGAAPAEVWDVAPDENQAGGRLGVIASVTNPFCGSCDRTRLTADGQMRNCLFSRTETDLRGPLRDGASDEAIAELWLGGQFEKRAGHGIGEPSFRQPDRNMSAIGG